MDLQPRFLSDSHMALSPIREVDFESLYQAASDPLVWEQHPDRLRYKREVFAGFDYAFRFVDCVLFQIGQENMRSMKATEKLGTVRVREEILEGIKHFLYELDKGAWETRAR